MNIFPLSNFSMTGRCTIIDKDKFFSIENGDHAKFYYDPNKSEYHFVTKKEQSELIFFDKKINVDEFGYFTISTTEKNNLGIKPLKRAGVTVLENGILRLNYHKGIKLIVSMKNGTIKKKTINQINKLTVQDSK